MDLLTATAVITVATVTAIVLIERSKNNLKREEDERLERIERRRQAQLAAELDRVARNSEVGRRIVEAAPVKLTPVGNVKRDTYDAVPQKPAPQPAASLIVPRTPPGTFPAPPRFTGHAYTPEPDIITPMVVTSILMSDSRSCDSGSSYSSSDSGSSYSSSDGSSSSSSSCGE